jgi:hypothetical protein
MTPLHFAADRGDLAAARRLVAAGADPAALDDDGQTPADIALLCEHQVRTHGTTSKSHHTKGSFESCRILSIISRAYKKTVKQIKPLVCKYGTESFEVTYDLFLQ